MNTRSNETVTGGGGGIVRPALMADMLRFGVRFEAEDGAGGGAPGATEEPAAPAKPARKTQPVPVTEAKPDNSVELTKELETLQQRLAAYGGATPEEIAELRKLKEDKAARDAEAARKAREEEERRLRDAGNFEALRERMAEEHKREMEAATSRTQELNQTVGALRTQIEALTMGANFGGSRFLTEETVLGASKAQKLYGDYFDIEGGQLVPYDAPRGSAKRVKIVDSRGQPKPFEDAIRQIIEADPDRDRILRPKQKPGTGIVPTATRPVEKTQERRGLERLRGIVPSLMPPK